MCVREYEKSVYIKCEEGRWSVYIYREGARVYNARKVCVREKGPRGYGCIKKEKTYM